MMMTQGNSYDNDDAGGLSTKHSRFHYDNDVKDNIDELYTNAFVLLKF